MYIQFRSVLFLNVHAIFFLFLFFWKTYFFFLNFETFIQVFSSPISFLMNVKKYRQ